jgi:hypothetical protein
MARFSCFFLRFFFSCQSSKSLSNQDSDFVTIRQIFENYIKYNESTDSSENKSNMIKSLKNINIVKKPKHLELLINVWMYYDPTDFNGKSLILTIFKKNREESIVAINNRIENKKKWEDYETAPYSDLVNLLKVIEN